MKQTISTIYPPPTPNRKKQHMQKKTPQTLNGFQRGSHAAPQPPPPPPRIPFILFCYATSKTFEWHFAGGPMVDRQCVLAGIGYVHVLYRQLVALH